MEGADFASFANISIQSVDHSIDRTTTGPRKKEELGKFVETQFVAGGVDENDEIRKINANYQNGILL